MAPRFAALIAANFQQLNLLRSYPLKRSLVIGALMALACGAAVAQPAPAPSGPAPSPVGPPRAFTGYSQPDITPGLCRNVSQQVTECVIPQATAGRYLIEAQGTSTAPKPNAKQQLSIYLFDGAFGRICGQTQPATWTTGPRTQKLNCMVTLLTDRPITVRVTYADENATRDPAGPRLTIRRLNWDGIVEMSASVPQ